MTVEFIVGPRQSGRSERAFREACATEGSVFFEHCYDLAAFRRNWAEENGLDSSIVFCRTVGLPQGRLVRSVWINNADAIPKSALGTLLYGCYESDVRRVTFIITNRDADEGVRGE